MVHPKKIRHLKAAQKKGKKRGEEHFATLKSHQFLVKDRSISCCCFQNRRSSRSWFERCLEDHAMDLPLVLLIKIHLNLLICKKTKLWGVVFVLSKYFLDFEKDVWKKTSNELIWGCKDTSYLRRTTKSWPHRSHFIGYFSPLER